MIDSNENHSEDTELINTHFYTTRKDIFGVLLIMTGFTAVLAIGFIYVLGLENMFKLFDGFSLNGWISKQSEQGLTSELVILLLAFIFFPVFWLAGKQRIYINSKGIYFHANLPEFIKWINKDWEFLWSEIQTVELVQATSFQNRAVRKIFIVSDDDNKKMIPEFWKTKEEGKKESGFYGLKFRKFKVNSMENLKNSIIYKRIVEAGFSIDLSEREDKSIAGFALEKNPRAKAFMFGLAALGLYVFIDGLVVPETYPSIPVIYEVVWASITLAIILILLVWLRAGDIPWGVCFGLGFIFFFVFYPTLYIGTLRANMLTDTNGMTSYRYRVQPGITLKPERIDLPEITYFDHSQFWNQYLPDKIIYIELRRGGLGIWQFNLEKVQEAMRDYHKNGLKKTQPEKTKSDPSF